jgi:hypothetical protein
MKPPFIAYAVLLLSSSGAIVSVGSDDKAAVAGHCHA